MTALFKEKPTTRRGKLCSPAYMHSTSWTPAECETLIKEFLDPRQHSLVCAKESECISQTSEYRCSDLYQLTQLLVSQCKSNEQIAKGGRRNALWNCDIHRPQTQGEFKELPHELLRLILEILPKPIDWTNSQLCKQI